MCPPPLSGQVATCPYGGVPFDKLVGQANDTARLRAYRDEGFRENHASLALPRLENQPPLPPLVRGAKKRRLPPDGEPPAGHRGVKIAIPGMTAKPPSFSCPPVKGGRGGWFYGVSLSRGLPSFDTRLALSGTFSTTPTRGWGVNPTVGEKQKSPRRGFVASASGRRKKGPTPRKGLL